MAGSGEDGAIAFSRSELLGAFGSCAAAGAKDFRAKATALDLAVATLVASPDDASRTAAREAFRQAMASWQAMDILQFGPTGPDSSVPGGRGFRDHIYAWPTFGRCAIEEELVAKSYESPNFGSLLFNRRTLAAAEYLLFYDGDDSACTTAASLSGWNALTPDERAARKRAYAAAAIKDVVARAAALDDAWDPAGMNFVETMRSAGSNPVYPKVQHAIESVGLAIFYLDRMVKDEKLAKPINSNNNCALGCFESPYAGLSKENLRANLDGFRRVMEGCEAGHTGLGFDDLLVSINARAIADTLRTQVIAAEAALDAITQPSLDQALIQNPAALNALRTAIGELTITVKTSLYTTLNFEPTIIPTDNDA